MGEVQVGVRPQGWSVFQDTQEGSPSSKGPGAERSKPAVTVAHKTAFLVVFLDGIISKY